QVRQVLQRSTPDQPCASPWGSSMLPTGVGWPILLGNPTRSPVWLSLSMPTSIPAQMNTSPAAANPYPASLTVLTTKRPERNVAAATCHHLSVDLDERRA